MAYRRKSQKKNFGLAEGRELSLKDDMRSKGFEPPFVTKLASVLSIGAVTALCIAWYAYHPPFGSNYSIPSNVKNYWPASLMFLLIGVARSAPGSSFWRCIQTAAPLAIYPLAPSIFESIPNSELWLRAFFGALVLSSCLLWSRPARRWARYSRALDTDSIDGVNTLTSIDQPFRRL